jgi:hypothetical protein
MQYQHNILPGEQKYYQYKQSNTQLTNQNLPTPLRFYIFEYAREHHRIADRVYYQKQ